MESFIKRLILISSGGTSISGTSSFSGVYQETISVNDPVYSILDGGVNKIYLGSNDLSEILTDISNINAIGYATSAGVATDSKSITAIWKVV